MPSTGQAFRHSPQRMQLDFRTTTPPPRRGVSASVGQDAAQGGGSQARHLLAAKPVESPPAERMRIPLLSQESFFMHQSGTGQSAAVTADALIETGCGELLHIVNCW
jgi:hypothetical protein